MLKVWSLMLLIWTLLGQVIRAIDLKYNELGEVITRTVSGIGIQLKRPLMSMNLIKSNKTFTKATSPLLTQLNQQDYRRLKAESRASVVAGKKIS
jgi:hypothetical protein